MKLVVLCILAPARLHPRLRRGVGARSRTGSRDRLNTGPHGFSEIVYAYTLHDQQQRHRLRGPDGQHARATTPRSAWVMWSAGSSRDPGAGHRRVDGRKKVVPASAGTFPTDTPLFGGLLVGVVIIVVGLTFFPVVALGPVVEHLLTPATSTDEGSTVMADSAAEPAPREPPAPGRPAASSTPTIVVPAVGDAFKQARPALEARNPVMFIVEVGSGDDHRAVLHRPLQPPARTTGSSAWSRLAVVHRAVRQLRRGGRRGPGQGPGDTLRQDPHARPSPAPPRGRPRRRGAPVRPELRSGDIVVVRGGGHDPRRRRRRRGHRLGRRVGDHRGVGAGHPRVRRRPLAR